MTRDEKILVLLLRLIAVAEWFAVIGILMPDAWMAACYHWLKLGDFPAAPITPYLARCLSAFYVMHGGFVWIAALDVRKYAILVRYIAITGIVFSVLVSVLDVIAGFPLFWTLAEGPTLTVISIVFLVLQHRISRADAAAGR